MNKKTKKVIKEICELHEKDPLYAICSEELQSSKYNHDDLWHWCEENGWYIIPYDDVTWYCPPTCNIRDPRAFGNYPDDLALIIKNELEYNGVILENLDAFEPCLRALVYLANLAGPLGNVKNE